MEKSLSDRMKERLARGERLLGTHICNADMFNAELISQTGFDYLWIDTEHTEIDKLSLDQILLALRAAGHASLGFVRVPKLDPDIVKPILDMGADGIIFPMIKTRADVDLAIASCEYPPKGIRGFSPRAAVRYGLDDVQAYVDTAGSRIWKLIQIETKEAYANLDDILGNPDADVFIIGPTDSSGAFGHLPDYKHPDVLPHIREAVAKIKAAGRPAAVSVGAYDQETAAFWFGLGVDMISMGTEFGFILDGCRAALANMRAAGKSTA
mgnify:CR=1 FL=1